MRSGKTAKGVIIANKNIGNTTTISSTIIVITGLSIVGILAHDAFLYFYHNCMLCHCIILSKVSKIPFQSYLFFLFRFVPLCDYLCYPNRNLRISH